MDNHVLHHFGQTSFSFHLKLAAILALCFVSSVILEGEVIFAIGMFAASALIFFVIFEAMEVVLFLAGKPWREVLFWLREFGRGLGF